MLTPSPDPEFLIVVMPNKEDVLVLMGLSLVLYRLSHGSLPKDGYRLSNQVDQFYYSLQQMGKVDRLYRLDLMDSLRIIPISLILEKVKPFFGEGSVCYNLISSFLYHPIIDDDGNHISFGAIPPVGEITRVLFNIVLMDIFDREFAKRFPGIAFSRFISDVYISTRVNDSVIFDDKAGYALLEELSLAGKIVSIGPGDDPLPCYSKIVYLDNDSKRETRSFRACTPVSKLDNRSHGNSRGSIASQVRERLLAMDRPRPDLTD
uniref:Reverse transcriptase domain-containing protein n=1 Tax=Acer yangbiense TaxID=1000413 RepID=A0A5C7GQC4_9ROSI